MERISSMTRPIVQPSVAHFHQYTIKAIEDTEDGWKIVFENDGEIVSHLKKNRPKNDIVGMSLLTTIISKDETILKLGESKINTVTQLPEPDYQADVVLNPVKMEINDPRYESLPQAPDTDADEIQLLQDDPRAAEAPEPPAEEQVGGGKLPLDEEQPVRDAQQPSKGTEEPEAPAEQS